MSHFVEIQVNSVFGMIHFTSLQYKHSRLTFTYTTYFPRPPPLHPLPGQEHWGLIPFKRLVLLQNARESERKPESVTSSLMLWLGCLPQEVTGGSYTF